MRNQNTELKKYLKAFVQAVGKKKGDQWALETKAEMQASERYAMAFDVSIGGGDTNLGRITGWEVGIDASWDNADNITTFSGGKKRITPHDTGNLIEAISNQYVKKGDVQEFSVGVDYNKLDRHRMMYSWLFERHGKPGVYVKRPGKLTSGAYVKAANRNSDENPGFLAVWAERGKSNVQRVFK